MCVVLLVVVVVVAVVAIDSFAIDIAVFSHYIVSAVFSLSLSFFLCCICLIGCICYASNRAWNQFTRQRHHIDNAENIINSLLVVLACLLVIVVHFIFSATSTILRLYIIILYVLLFRLQEKKRRLCSFLTISYEFHINIEWIQCNNRARKEEEAEKQNDANANATAIEKPNSLFENFQNETAARADEAAAAVL